MSIAADNQQVAVVLKKSVVKRIDRIADDLLLSRGRVIAILVETSLGYEESVLKARNLKKAERSAIRPKHRMPTQEESEI